MSRNTQYLRGKTRERGSQSARFMTDGFDRWAENETPASFNSVEKNPTELTKGTMVRGMTYGKTLEGMVGNGRKGRAKCGGALLDDVAAGWGRFTNEFTNPESYLQQGIGQVTNEFTNPESVLQSQYLPALTNEFTNKDSLLRAQYLGQAADGVSKAAPILDMLGEQMGLGKGVGKTMAEVLKAAQEVNKAAKSVGLGRGGRSAKLPTIRPPSDFVEKLGNSQLSKEMNKYSNLLGKLMRGEAPMPGMSGGRSWYDGMTPPKTMPVYTTMSMPKIPMVRGSRKPSARNEVVRRVMAERGVSLPTASSIVKREGLY